MLMPIIVYIIDFLLFSPIAEKLPLYQATPNTPSAITDIETTNPGRRWISIKRIRRPINVTIIIINVCNASRK